MKYEISSPVAQKCLLGEGPFWDNEENVLYWVDILAHLIFRYNPANGTVQQWQAGEPVGFVVTRGKQKFAGLKSGLVQLEFDNGGIKKEYIHRLGDKLPVRFNDATVDANGNIWACTMDMNNVENAGDYFVYDESLKPVCVDKNYVVANGPALSKDGRYLYTVETIGNEKSKKGVYVSEVHNLSLRNKRMLIPWRSSASHPDGVITDDSGNLWIGEFGSNVLRCFSQQGRLKLEIALPAWNITKACFQGNDPDVLFVTSASISTTPKQQADFPLTGQLIKISGCLTVMPFPLR